MASVVTHIVDGRKVFDRLENLSWPEFLTGTLFPDIRHLAKVDREVTHVYNTSENQIPKDNSFQAGMYTHSLIDEKRNNFLNDRSFYSIIPGRLYRVPYKLVEDEINYNKIDDWEGVIRNILNDIPLISEFRVSKEISTKWYDLIREYCKIAPNEKSWVNFFTKLGYDTEKVKEIINQTRIIKDNMKVTEIIKETYNII